MNNAEATEAITAALVDVPDMDVGAVIVDALDALAVEAEDAKRDHRQLKVWLARLRESVEIRARRVWLPGAHYAGTPATKPAKGGTQRRG